MGKYTKEDFRDNIFMGTVPSKTYDHIVIGSGPGGSITACKLAEAGKNVLLIEEGRYLDLWDIDAFSVEEMQEKYRNGGLTLTFGEFKVNYVEGKCVGGGSEVNSGLYHRTPLEVLKQWEQDFSVKNCTMEALEPYFKECERDVCVSYNPGKLPDASLKLSEGAGKLGWSHQEVPKWFEYDQELNSSGYASGIKKSMTQSYIPRFLKAGGHLLTETRCLSFKESSTSYEVYLSSNSFKFTLNCAHLFICCGAVHTPTLLKRSGFSKNIGRSFFLHPTIKATALFGEVVNAEGMGVPVHQIKEFSPQFSLGCSISSPAYLAMAMNDHPDHLHLVKDFWQNMAIYYAMTNAVGQGGIKLMPGFKDPFVQYKMTKAEMENLALGLRKLCELLLQAGAKSIFTSIPGSIPIRSVADLSAIPRTIRKTPANLMTIHLFSSCPMGENEEKCGANSYGKVYQSRSLYINDASLLPTSLGVNPQGTIMALALRNINNFISTNN